MQPSERDMLWVAESQGSRSAPGQGSRMGQMQLLLALIWASQLCVGYFACADLSCCIVRFGPSPMEMLIVARHAWDTEAVLVSAPLDTNNSGLSTR